MDIRLRQLARIADADPTYYNQQTYINALLQTGDYFTAIRLGTPSRLLRNGYLLVRLDKMHIVISPDFKLFSLDVQLTRAMSGFAFDHVIEETNYQTIGDDYPFPVNTPPFRLWLYGRTHLIESDPLIQSPAWMQLLSADDRQILVNGLIDIADSYLFPLPWQHLTIILNNQLKTSELAGPVTDGWVATPFFVKTSLALSMNQISLLEDNSRIASLIAKLLIEYNNMHMLKLVKKLDAAYHNYDQNRPLFVGEKIEEPYFQRSGVIEISAELPIRNEYRNIISERAYFKAFRGIDYDYLSSSCQGYRATLPLTGVECELETSERPSRSCFPNQRCWYAIRNYRFQGPFAGEEGEHFRPNFPSHWPIHHVLNELAAICEMSSFSQQQLDLALAKIAYMAQPILPIIAERQGYGPEEYDQLKIAKVSYFRDYDMVPPLLPTIILVETEEKINFQAGTLELNKILRSLGLIGHYDARIWVTDVANNVDLSDIRYWELSSY